MRVPVHLGCRVTQKHPPCTSAHTNKGLNVLQHGRCGHIQPLLVAQLGQQLGVSLILLAEQVELLLLVTTHTYTCMM